jgi:hypothetical protein
MIQMSELSRTRLKPSGKTFCNHLSIKAHFANERLCSVYVLFRFQFHTVYLCILTIFDGVDLKFYFAHDI